MISNKEKYRALCTQEFSIPVFSQAWWLDSTAEDCWDVVLLEKDGEILASLPYILKKRYGFIFLTQPVLTQNLGPWLRKNSLKYSKKLAQEKDLLQELYSKLPKHDSYSQSWHYKLTNWLPLYWLNYEQTTKYTYVIPDISNIDEVVNNFEHSKRKNIKKSEKIIKIVFDISPEEFYDNHKITLKKQGQSISYSFEVFLKLYINGYENNSAKTIAAYDEFGNLHAALFVVWDKNSAYNLISTIDPDFRVHGAASLLIKESIKYVSNFVNKFDFEGSMIESVERSFRQFGAVQVPYFAIKKTSSRMLKLLQILHKLKNGW